MRKQIVAIASCVEPCCVALKIFMTSSLETASTADRKRVWQSSAYVRRQALTRKVFPACLLLLCVGLLTACASKKVHLDPDPVPPAFSEVPTVEERQRLQDKRQRLQEGMKAS